MTKEEMTNEEITRCMNEYIKFCNAQLKAESAKIIELQNIKRAIYLVGMFIYCGLILVACSV